MAGPARFRNTRVLVATYIVLSLLVITIDYRSGDRGPLAAGSRALIALLAPFQSAVSSVVDPIGDFSSTLLHLPEIRRENTELRDRVAELQQEVATATADEKRLALLESLLDVQAQLGPDTASVAAQVIANGVSNFEWSVQLDVGTSAGVQVGMPVVASAGLVGRVIRVASNTATVQLILDPDCAVAGRLGLSGTTGIVTGQGDQELRMGLVDTAATVTAQDAVVTAGYDIPGVGTGAYPPGILIGQVSRVLPDAGALETYITVRPAVDFATLDLVLVILGERR